MPGREDLRGPIGSCEEVQPGTYPSPTTTHLMACIVSGAWQVAVVTARGVECFCGQGTRGAENLVRHPD